MPSLRFLGAAAALLTVGAQAQAEDRDFVIAGNSTLIGPFKGSQGAPDATLSADFQAWDLGEDWTWRVNVTSIPRPGARQPSPFTTEDPPELDDPHVVRTTWDFSWPGGGNLTDNIGNASRICIAFIDRSNWPANVSSLYQETPNGEYESNCGPVIGSACVRAYVSQQLYNNDTNSCGIPDSVASLPECRDTLGYGRDLSISSMAMDLASMQTLQSGDGFYTQLLEAHDGSDADRYLQHAKDHVQMAITEIVYHEDNMVTTGRQMHCLRVNPAKEQAKSPEQEAEDEDDDEDNEQNKEEEEGGDGSGVGSVRSGGVAWVVALAGAASLSVVLS